jgi:hypothetical protein
MSLSVAERVRNWGKKRLSINQRSGAAGGPKKATTRRSSRNPSFVESADDASHTLLQEATDPTGVPQVSQEVKDRLMSAHGVSLAYMIELGDGIQQSVHAPGTRLVVLSKEAHVRESDGRMRVLPPFDTTARILYEDTGNVTVM